MQTHLYRIKNFRQEHAIITTFGRRLKIEETKTNSFYLKTVKSVFYDDESEATKEAEKFITRRLKCGFALVSQIDSPWVDWLFNLERLAASIKSYAQDLNYKAYLYVSKRVPAISTYYSEPPLHDDYAVLEKCPSLTCVFTFDNCGLQISSGFGITSIARAIWNHSSYLTLYTFDKTLARGSLNTEGVMQSDLGEDGQIIHQTAEEFRSFFLDYIKNRFEEILFDLH